MSNLTAGEVAFSNLTEHEMYNGRSTECYSVVIRMDDAEAVTLSDMGVKLKEYEGVMQRKFKSRYPIKVVDMENNPVNTELPKGTKVRLAWKDSPNEEHGTQCYLNAVRVVELGEEAEDLPSDF